MYSIDSGETALLSVQRFILTYFVNPVWSHDHATLLVSPSATFHSFDSLRVVIFIPGSLQELNAGIGLWNYEIKLCIAKIFIHL